MTEGHSRTTTRLAWGLGLALGAAALALPSTAQANPYETFIDIDNEDDLYDLQVANEISDDTFEILIDLLRRGINLNTATREQLYTLPNLTYDEVDAILAYRDEAGRIGDPAALVIAGVVSRRKLSSIAAFLRVPAPDGSNAAVRGYVRYQTIWTSEDKRAPPMALQARVSTLRHLTIGAVGLLDRNRVAPVTWDPNRNALSTEGPRTFPRVPKYFAQWDTPKWGIIAGTYTIGFGQRLVMDTTGRYTPNGFTIDDTVIRRTYLTTQCRESAGELDESPCADANGRTYVTPDFNVRDRQRGIAVGAKHIDMPEGWMQVYGFFSHQPRQVYQYGIFDRSICDDPNIDSSRVPECGAPDVYLRGDDILAPSSTLRFATLPNMYNEIQGGGNISYFFDRRTHVGATAYGADTQWLVDGAQLDFQEWQRTPWGGPFGAAGADASWGRGWADIFLEVAQSFDSVDVDGGGGPAAILRHTATWENHEIEASARYYDEHYQNPYSRAISAADVTNGLRASDEAGGRIRYSGHLFDRLDLRSQVDVWNELSSDRTKLSARVRGDVQTLDWLRPGLWVDYQTRDITASGRNRCYSVFNGEADRAEANLDTGAGIVPLDNPSTYEEFIRGGIDTGGCAGERVWIMPRVRFDPHKRVSLTTTFQYYWTDDARYENRFSNRIRLVGIVNANPVDPLRLNFRITWNNEAIEDSAYLSESVWAYLQASYKVTNWFQPSVRYDIRAWLDDRESTALRAPNPEHWLLFQVRSRF